VIAGTWASMLKHGVKGYEQKAKGILEAQKNIVKAFKGNEDIQITSGHSSSIFSFTSKKINSIALVEQM
jgi:glutamate/tyrosine decarboxylase-like PLP-dependent enzyme